MDSAAPPSPPSIQSPAPDVAQVEVIQDAPPRPPEHGALELGLGAFLLSGGAAGGYLGATPFVMIDAGQGVYVRPSLVIGQSTSTTIHSWLAGGRIDTCARLEGNYRAGSGIQLDLCGGIDAGLARVDAGAADGDPASALTLPYLDLGPSIDLRGELGQLAVTVRAVAGFDVTGSSYVDVTGATMQAPRVPLRIELAFSWDLHGGPPSAPPATPEFQARR